jgi:hypothetical protein
VTVAHREIALTVIPFLEYLLDCVPKREYGQRHFHSTRKDVMSKTTWIFALVVAGGLSFGCSTTKPTANIKSTVASEAVNHSAIQPTTTQNGRTTDAAKKDDRIAMLTHWLELNDEVVEKKQELIQGFQKQFEPYKATLFQAAGGKGEVADFRVDDVFFYKGYLAVQVRYFWKNEDRSGGFGVGYISIDPDKDFDIAGCSIARQVMISADEVAALEGGNRQPVQQVETQSAPKSSDFSMSDDTKQFLIKAGIGVGAALIQSWLSGQ